MRAPTDTAAPAARAPGRPRGPRSHRSSLGRACGLLAALLVLGLAWTCGGREPEQAFSTQLHVHGSFSEWIGSIDSHSYEASRLGLDAIWWSDHDFRIATYRQPARFGFEQELEPFDEDEHWTALQRPGVKQLRPLTVEVPAAGQHELSSDVVHSGARSLHITAAATAGATAPGRYLLYPAATRTGFRRPLAAELTVHLAVRPGVPSAASREQPAGHALLQVGLSEHAPRGGLGEVPYMLRYVLGGEVSEHREGAVYYLPLELTPGEWNELALPITRDVERAFPELVGADNGLTHFAFGVEVPPGAEAEAWFDDLRIEQVHTGSATYARQAELLEEVGRGYPQLRQLQGVEISNGTDHLNEFSLATELLDYDALAGELDEQFGTPAKVKVARPYLSRRAVELVHGRDGLVSYNHMFGTTGPESEAKTSNEAVLAELLSNRLFGADLLEVGYRDRGGHDLDDHLWVWDRLAQAGLFPVGIGVSDSHGGQRARWETAENNFVSWIWARSTDKADLLEGLRAGRVFFGDLVLFDGTLDLSTPNGWRMGQVVETARKSVTVELTLTDAAPGDRVTLLVNGSPLDEVTCTRTVLTHEREVALDATVTTVRVEVYDPSGRAKVFSNPITFVAPGAASDTGTHEARIARE